MIREFLERHNFLREDKVPPELARQVGWSESRLYSKDIPKYNPDKLIGRQGHDIYQKMMTDEQVKAVVTFKRDAITSRDYFFEFAADVNLPDSEQEERIGLYDKMLESYRGSFNDGLNFVMKGVWQGFSMTEMLFDVFNYRDRPYIGLACLKPKPYESFQFHTDKFGTIQRTVQHLDSDSQEIDLSKFIYFVNNPEFDLHYGQSDLREAYRSWYSKDVIIRFANIHLEKMAGGMIIARPKDGTTLTVGSRDFAAVQAIIDSIQTATSALIPSNIEIELLSGSATDAFEKAITMHDLQIAKALLVPNLLGITHTGQTGAYSQSQTQLEAFLWTLDAAAARLADALNEQIFSKTHVLNFADGIGPRFKFKPVSEEMKMKIVERWQNLVQSGAVEASDTDEEHLRELLDFPEKGEPIHEPPTVVTDPSGGPGSQEPDGEDELPDETLTADSIGQLYSREAFNRAIKRVSFAVIDRQTRDMEDRHTESVESALADMVSGTIEVIRDDKLGTPAGSVESIGSLDFARRDKTRVRRSVDSSLRDGWRYGVRHANSEVGKARRERFEAHMGRIDDEAAEFIKAKGFRMLGGLTDNMRAIVQNVLFNGLKFSWTTDDIVNKIYDSLTLAGFLLMNTNTEATSRSLDEVREALEDAVGGAHRVRTAVRTNTFEAINEARFSVFTDPELGDFVEGLEYSAILDGRTTEICRHLNGRAYPVGSPHWNSIRPPNHHNCRSLLVPITLADTDARGKDARKGDRWSRGPSKEPQQGFGGTTG